MERRDLQKKRSHHVFRTLFWCYKYRVLWECIAVSCQFYRFQPLIILWMNQKDKGFNKDFKKEKNTLSPSEYSQTECINLLRYNEKIWIQLYDKDSLAVQNNITYVVSWMQFHSHASLRSEKPYKWWWQVKNKYFIKLKLKLKLKSSVSPPSRQGTEKINHPTVYGIILRDQ